MKIRNRNLSLIMQLEFNCVNDEYQAHKLATS